MKWRLAATISPALLGVMLAQQQGAPASPGQGVSVPDTASDGMAGATPTIRTNVRLVVLDVVVTDSQGGSVRGLKQQDLRVLENGHEQAVKVFEEHDNTSLQAVKVPERVVLPVANEASNEVTNAGQETRSTALSVILLDTLNTANSDQSFARTELKNAMAGLAPGSRIAIFVLGRELHMVQGFTTDTSLLAKAVDRSNLPVDAMVHNDSERELPSVLPRNYLRDATAQGDQDQKDGMRAARTFSAFTALTNYLSALPGKKNLWWLAGSFPFDFSMHDLATQMLAGHIAVYPVDVRGLTSSGLYGGATMNHPDLGAFSAATMTQLGQEQAMENIALETGGRAIYNNNDIQGEISKSLNQGENFYTVAYSPANKDWNGKYRNIEIKTDRKNVKLYYRRGYFADAPGKEDGKPEFAPKFAVAMLRGAPEPTEVMLVVKATPTDKYLENKDPKPSEQKDPKLLVESHPQGKAEVYLVDCRVDPGTVGFSKTKEGRYLANLTLALLAFNADGKVLSAETRTFGEPLSEEQYHAVLRRGLTIRQEMELPLGHIYLRVGVHDLQSDKVGATEMPILISSK